MLEPSQRQLDSDLEKSMAMFKRAAVGKTSAPTMKRPESILLALDGSQQDEVGVGIAKLLRQRFNASILVLDARMASEHAPLPAPPSSARGEEIAGRVEGTLVVDEAQESFDRILHAIETHRPDMAIAPCPFGRDFNAIGADSTGTVIDVLLARCPVPLLVTRAPFDVQDRSLAEIRIVVSGENNAAAEAARWATGLATRGGSLELSLVVPEEYFAICREALHAVHPEEEFSSESVENALAASYARLHASLQHSGAAGHYRYTLNVHRTSEDVTFDHPTSEPPLLVLPLDRNAAMSQGQVHQRIRHSPHPVLVVATHAPPS
ncbi:MAG: hypothetical protein KDA61_04930 [Planctomycetales bacterium]|nr:hypothetical protein [Planctomycetales bacterium]